MLQLIKKIFSLRQAKDGKKKNKSYDGTKQLREMGKLGGKLILM